MMKINMKKCNRVKCTIKVKTTGKCTNEQVNKFKFDKN